MTFFKISWALNDIQIKTAFEDGQFFRVIKYLLSHDVVLTTQVN